MNKGYEMVLLRCLTIFVVFGSVKQQVAHGNVPEEIGDDSSQLTSLTFLESIEHVFSNKLRGKLHEDDAAGSSMMRAWKVKTADVDWRKGKYAVACYSTKEIFAD
nr:receptor-like protein 12 [Ipomoea batatas]